MYLHLNEDLTTTANKQNIGQKIEAHSRKQDLHLPLSASLDEKAVIIKC